MQFFNKSFLKNFSTAEEQKPKLIQRGMQNMIALLLIWSEISLKIVTTSSEIDYRCLNAQSKVESQRDSNDNLLVNSIKVWKVTK